MSSTGLLLGLPILLFSVIIHEVSHGWVAKRLGDDTADRFGRLTLNPLPHVDPLGTILLPALCLISGYPPFGWAKPVPVDVSRLDNPSADSMKVSFAGPASNLLLALIAAAGFRLVGLVTGMNPLLSGNIVGFFFVQAVLINLVLAFFNLIPIHPLDGSHVLRGLLPPKAREIYLRHVRYGFLILLGLMFLGVIRVVLQIPLALAGRLLLF